MYHVFLMALTICMGSYIFSSETSYAVVIVPVADTTGHFMGSKNDYKKFAFAPNNGDHSCPRFHQLLFNEIVKIVKERGEEVEAEFLNVFYVDLLGRKSRGFWTLKKNLLYLEKISPELISKTLPKPYTSDIVKNISKTNKVLTLTLPWYDKVTQKNYSAGTRFVRNYKEDTKDSYSIFLLNNNMQSVAALVKKTHAVIDVPDDSEKRVENFITLMKFWITQSEKKKQAIPYVWGGCSFIKTYDSVFWLEKGKNHDVYTEAWMRPEKNIPFTGLECSSLIFRAAQICNMPYYLKNSATIASCLDHLGVQDKIMNGDIIWYPGHVVIVSDVKNNMVLESSGYMLGYGKVHELPLEKMFNNIQTFQQLKEALHNKAQLIRLDSEGKKYKTIKQFKVMKIRSIWTR